MLIDPTYVPSKSIILVQLMARICMDDDKLQKALAQQEGSVRCRKLCGKFARGSVRDWWSDTINNRTLLPGNRRS